MSDSTPSPKDRPPHFEVIPISDFGTDPSTIQSKLAANFTFAAQWMSPREFQRGMLLRWNQAAFAKFGETLVRIDGAFSPKTIQSFREKFLRFLEFCESEHVLGFPTPPSLIVRYLGHMRERGLAIGSIRMAVWSISAMHRWNYAVDPTNDPEVLLGIRRVYRQVGRYSEQAFGIRQEMLEQLLLVTGDYLLGIRDKALLLTAYDTMCRRSELVELLIEDLQCDDVMDPKTKQRRFIFRILLRHSKTDPHRKGKWLILSPECYEAIQEWLHHANIESGPIFRGIQRYTQKVSSLRLYSGQLGRIYKRLARQAGFPDDIVSQISGHSFRVGAAQDLMLSGASLAQLMSKGRWSKTDTVMRYVEHFGGKETLI